MDNHLHNGIILKAYLLPLIQLFLNLDISNWDVSNVIDMTNMFIFASAFNQDLNSWNISNVTECNGFSYEASAWTLPKPNFTNCNTGD